MVQNCEVNETSIIQNNSSSSSPSSPSTTKKSFSSRLTHLIRRDPTKNSSNNNSLDNSLSYSLKKSTKVYQTQMILLDQNDPKYIIVKSLFKGQPLSQSTILGIFELRMPTKLEKRHESYKESLSKKTGETTESITHRMFHGTTSNCSPQRFVEDEEIENDVDKNYCEKDCGLCGIIRQGNRTKYTRTKSLFRRNKMWFANDPCTSLYYCNGVYSGVERVVKSMFVVDVIKKAPKGIFVISKERAALPRFLILFEMSGSCYPDNF